MGVLAEVKQTHGCGSKRKQESEIERGIPASTAYISIPPYLSCTPFFIWLVKFQETLKW